MTDIGEVARSLDKMLPRLGKRPKKTDPRTLQFSDYLKAATLPTPPASADYSTKLTNLGMMKNDTVGCCTCAAAGHIVQDATSYEGSQVIIPDADILALYSQVSGYNPVTGANDNGAACLDVLNAWKQSGFQGPQGPHKIAAYAELSLSSSEVSMALYLIGAVYIGIQLPIAWQEALSWDVPPGGATGNGAPGSWGGHCVPIIAFSPDGVIVISWGQKILLTWTAFGIYVDEAYVPVTQDFVNAQGQDPAGLSLAQMVADANALSSAPAPAPAAQPRPSWWKRFLHDIGFG